jgi:hypothetical protein
MIIRDDMVQQEESDDALRADFCHRLWQFMAAMCCGSCCNCWCQCCGMCAIAQEHRHLQKVLPQEEAATSSWQRDYITMQPWYEYMPGIYALRESGDGVLWAHIKAMSLLSSRLLWAVEIILVVLLVVAFLPVDLSFWQFLVVCIYDHWAESLKRSLTIFVVCLLCSSSERSFNRL